ncbi:MAG: hypothetical protein KIS61_10415 [Candidatus Eremiobacteraeota bacterium]|nr:hypothetical protein [Candidatus Eremiobacteraeota bacterium]
MKRRAFTLVENLLAFTLISLVLILLLNLFPSSMATVRKSEQRYKALTLAGNRLEEQTAMPFSKLVLDSSEHHPVDDYQVQTEVLAIDGEDKAWLKLIRVTVSWKYRDQSRKVVRETRVHRLASQL